MNNYYYNNTNTNSNQDTQFNNNSLCHVNNNSNNNNYDTSVGGYQDNYPPYFDPSYSSYNNSQRDTSVSSRSYANIYLSAYEEARYGAIRREATIGTYQQYQCMLYGQQHPWQAFETSFSMQSYALPPSVPAKQKRPRMSMQKRLLVNARERERMRVLNKAFESLRDALPCYIADGHMAKITTLRLAINYIRALSELLNDQSKIEKNGDFKNCPENLQEQLFTSILKESSSTDEKLCALTLDEMKLPPKTVEDGFASKQGQT